jgi:hypothetical protein
MITSTMRFLAGAVLLGGSLAATAVPVRWTLANVRFDDGGTATGYFVFDADTNAFTDRAISVAGGNTTDFPPIVYGTANADYYYGATVEFPTSMLIAIGDRHLRMTPATALTNAGGTIAINVNAASWNVECFNCGPARVLVSGNLIGTVVGPTFPINATMSGNWFDPAQDGHGFQLEVLPGGVVTAFWFTFDNLGNQAWIAGIGVIEGDHVVMNAVRVLNGRFPPNFNPAAVERRPWGTLTFTFTDCNRGRVEWTTNNAGFTATGTMSLTRVTALDGLGCQ